jgi:hypothetical protein
MHSWSAHDRHARPRARSHMHLAAAGRRHGRKRRRVRLHDRAHQRRRQRGAPPAAGGTGQRVEAVGGRRGRDARRRCLPHAQRRSLLHASGRRRRGARGPRQRARRGPARVRRRARLRRRQQQQRRRDRACARPPAGLAAGGRREGRQPVRAEAQAEPPHVRGACWVGAVLVCVLPVAARPPRSRESCLHLLARPPLGWLAGPGAWRGRMASVDQPQPCSCSQQPSLRGAAGWRASAPFCA